jgi:hypothetical protein
MINFDLVFLHEKGFIVIIFSDVLFGVFTIKNKGCG